MEDDSVLLLHCSDPPPEQTLSFNVVQQQIFDCTTQRSELKQPDSQVNLTIKQLKLSINTNETVLKMKRLCSGYLNIPLPLLIFIRVELFKSNNMKVYRIFSNMIVQFSLLKDTDLVNHLLQYEDELMKSNQYKSSYYVIYDLSVVYIESSMIPFYSIPIQIYQV